MIPMLVFVIVLFACTAILSATVSSGIVAPYLVACWVWWFISGVRCKTAGGGYLCCLLGTVGFTAVLTVAAG